MKGMMATIAEGGAKRHNLLNRLMKDAIIAEERWFCGERKVSRWRSTRERYLEWSSWASRSV